MHAQNWKQPFDEEVAKAKDRHQQAIAEAHDAFKQAERRAWEKRNADYRAAQDTWDAVKSLSECAEVTEARQAFDLAKAPASLAPARKALAEAIDRADQRFQEEVARLGQEHGMTVR